MTTYRHVGGIDDNISPHSFPPCQHCGRFAATEGRYCATCKSAGAGNPPSSRKATKKATKKKVKATDEDVAWVVVVVGAWAVLCIPIALICAGIGYGAEGLSGLLVGLGLTPFVSAGVIYGVAHYVERL